MVCGHHDDELVAAIAEAVVLFAAQFLEALPGASSSSLPTRWPWTSLTSLNWSRSMKARLIGWPCGAAAFQFAPQNIVKMADVVEAGGVVGDGELLNAGDVVGILDGDGGVIGRGCGGRRWCSR